MDLYLLTWKTEHTRKMEVFRAFSEMTAADHAAAEEAAGIRIIVRVHSPSDGSGAGICEAASVENVHAYCMNWAPFLNCTVTGVLDDAAARKVTLAYFASTSGTI